MDCTDTIVDAADEFVEAKRKLPYLSLGNSKKCGLSRQ
jgi:hypothetical protein